MTSAMWASSFGELVLEVSVDGAIIGVAVAAGTVVGVAATAAAAPPLLIAAAVGATVGITAGALNQLVNWARGRPTGGSCKVAGRIVLATLVGAAVGASTVWLLAAGVPAWLITGVPIVLGVASTAVAAARKYGPTGVRAVVAAITKVAPALVIATGATMLKRPGKVATAI